MERLGGHGPEFVRKTTAHGAYMHVNVTPVTFRATTEVAEHEADHVVAAGAIQYATIIRQGDALGTTVPVRMTASGAAAAGAHGGRGTGHDQLVTEFYLGVPWESAKAQARAVLAGRSLERKAVASKLMEKGTIYQSDVDDAVKEAERAKKGLAKVDVFVIDRAGRKTSYTSETTRTAKEIVNELEEKEQKGHEEEIFRWTPKDQELFEAETVRWSAHDQVLFEAEADRQLVKV